MIPRLETSRLVLRAHGLADYPACVDMWADPLVCRFTIGQPSPSQRTWMRIMSYVGHWSLLGFGYWAVEEKASGRYIGELGFADFKRGMNPSLEGVPELGWALAVSAHGKGYATEALQAAVAWGDTRFSGGRTVAIIQKENAASLRVAEKIGYREVRRVN
jgi:RimJ/RimL family protein N-acetyltransferase